MVHILFLLPYTVYSVINPVSLYACICFWVFFSVSSVYLSMLHCCQSIFITTALFWYLLKQILPSCSSSRITSVLESPIQLLKSAYQFPWNIPSVMELVQCHQHSRWLGWSLWKMVLYLGLTVSLRGWQVENSAGAVVRPALVSGGPYCQART